MRYIGLLLSFLPLICFADNCDAIQGAVPLFPGNGAAIFPGTVEFNFTIFPEVDIGEACSLTVVVNEDEVTVTIPPTKHYTSDIFSVYVDVPSYSKFLTWYIFNGTNLKYPFSSSNVVCVAEAPAAPGLSIDKGLITADLNGVGHCCNEDPDEECIISVQFFLDADGGDERSRFLGSVIASDPAESCSWPIPDGLKGTVTFRAQVCTGKLCGNFSAINFTVGSDGPYAPQGVTLQNTEKPYKITWRYAQGAPDTLSCLIYISQAVDGPYRMFVAEDDHSFILEKEFLFGIFYFYIVTESSGIIHTSSVYSFTLRENVPPEPVELIWPKNGTNFSYTKEDVKIFYRSLSWGTVNDPDGLEPEYFINDAGYKGQVQTLSIKDVDNVALVLKANNGKSVSDDSYFTFNKCRPDEIDDDFDISFEVTATEVTVKWKEMNGEFCENLPGPHGYVVELVLEPGKDVLKQFVSSSETQVIFSVFRDTDVESVSATVTKFIDYDNYKFDTASATEKIEFVNRCDFVFTLSSLGIKRDTSVFEFPHPVQLTWESSLTNGPCAWQGFNIFIDDTLVHTSRSRLVRSYTIPSSLLKQENCTVNICVEAYSGVSTQKICGDYVIDDIEPLPFVNPTSPKSSSWNLVGNTIKLEWQSLGDEYEYEVCWGKDREALTLCDKTSSNEKQLNVDSGTYFWSVRACYKSQENGNEALCGNFSTAHALYVCANEDFEDTELSVEWNYPVVVSWTQTSFGCNCQNTEVNNNGGSFGKYIVQWKEEGESDYHTIEVLPSLSSVTLSELKVEHSYNIILIKTGLNSENCTLTEDGTVHPTNPPVVSIENENENFFTQDSELKWNVVWGRDCSDATNCESTVWIKSNDDVSLVARIPSGDRVGDQSCPYSVKLEKETYLLNRDDASLVVVAHNGMSSVSDSILHVETCRPNMPSTPALFSPADGEKGKRNRTFQIAPLQAWGDCRKDGDKYYVLHFDSNSSKKSETEMEAVSDGLVGITYYLPNGQYNWNMEAINAFNLRSNSSVFFEYIACEPEPPDEVKWTGGFNESVLIDYTANATCDTPEPPIDMSKISEEKLVKVSPHYFVLKYEELQGDQYGQYCGDKANTNSVTLFWRSQNTSWDIYERLKRGSIKIVPSNGTDLLEKDTMYFFYMKASNEQNCSLSKILAVKTFDKSCFDFNCTDDQGYCDPATVTCVCYEGFSGTLCEVDDVHEDMIKIIIGVCVGGGIVLAVIGVVVGISIRKYYKKHKALMMKPPDFEALRVPPIKMPSFSSDVTPPSDYSVLEAALLSKTGMQMIWELLRYTSATEIDIMAKSLVYAYQKHGRGLELQLFLIVCEIYESQTSTVLFRANSPATRAFKFFSKMYALPYLYRTFAVLLQGIIRDVDDMEEEAGKRPGDDDDEVLLTDIGDDGDDNACSDESLNALKLQLMCQKFFVQIMRSDKNCPGELKHICALLNEELQKRYPDFVFKGIGAFLFLRFYNTAITVPESYGLMPTSPRPSVRKQLLLVSKVLQNLANEVMFGEKEAHMVRLNTFLTSQRSAYQQFINRLCDKNAPLSELIPIPDDSYHAALAVIYNQFLVVTRNHPERLENSEYIPEDLAKQIHKSLKKHKKHKEDAALLDPATDSAPPADAEPPVPEPEVAAPPPEPEAAAPSPSNPPPPDVAPTTTSAANVYDDDDYYTPQG